MTEQEKRYMHHLVSNAPRSVWKAWVFVVPSLLTVASAGLLVYVRMQVSDLEIVFRHEYKIVRVWNAEQVTKILPTLAMMLTLLLGWIAALGLMVYQQTRLLQAAAPAVGIAGEDAGEFWKRRTEIARALRKNTRDGVVGLYLGLAVLSLMLALGTRLLAKEYEGVVAAGVGIGLVVLIAWLCVKSNAGVKALVREYGLECSQCGSGPKMVPRAIDAALEGGVCGKCGGRLGSEVRD